MYLILTLVSVVLLKTILGLLCSVFRNSIFSPHEIPSSFFGPFSYGTLLNIVFVTFQDEKKEALQLVYFFFQPSLLNCLWSYF